MSPTAVPTRITIDFREDVLPSRAWILGVGEPSARMELLAFEAPWTAPGANTPDPLGPLGVGVACTCPEFCERDHANE